MADDQYGLQMVYQRHSDESVQHHLLMCKPPYVTISLLGGG